MAQAMIADAGGRTRAGLIATAAAFGLTYGLSAPLIALELDARGVSNLLIGANAAMHAIGVLIIAPQLPHLVARLGLSRTAKLALVLAALLLAVFPFAIFLAAWFILRLGLGMASESLFVISESWLSVTTDDRSRARTMGIYVAAMSGGIALGPAILAVAGRSGTLPFFIGALLALVALAILVVTRPQEKPMPAPERGGMHEYFAMAPVAVAASALNAAIESAGLAFLPLYAIDLGWTESQATLLLTTLLVGAILMQLPVGWLGDRFSRNGLVQAFALISGLGALAWPMAMTHPWLAWPLLFLWGGCFVGIYTLVLTNVGQRFNGSELAGIFSAMSVAWGIGALTGPALAGAVMHFTGHGLPLMAAAMCLLFVLLCRVFDRPNSSVRPMP